MAKLGGICQLDINGLILPVKGDLDVILGEPLKEPIVGQDGTFHGHKETTRVSSIAGTMTLKPDVDWRAIQRTQDANVTARLPNGRILLLSNAVFTGEGGMNTEEAEMEFMFVGEGEYL